MFNKTQKRLIFFVLRNMFGLKIGSRYNSMTRVSKIRRITVCAAEL